MLFLIHVQHSVSMHTMTSIRINTMTRLLPRKFSSYRPGQYSRMMDMGGVPHTKSSIKLNFGQKNKIQAIALDFNLITRAVDEARSEGVTVGSSSNATTSNPGTSSGAPWLSSSATLIVATNRVRLSPPTAARARLFMVGSYRMLSIQLMKSPFSCAVQARA